MTLIMAILQDHEVTILNDTLTVTKDESGRLHFMSKAMAFPHLEVVATFSGNALFGLEWGMRLMCNDVARNIDDLARVTPDALRSLWAEFTSRWDGLDAEAPPSMTINHYGYSPEQERYVGYQYSSSLTGFDPLPHKAPSLSVAPFPTYEPGRPCATVDEARESLTRLDGRVHDLEGMVALAHELRAEQALVDPRDRIYIDGDLVLTLLKNRSIVTTKVGQFDGYDDCWARMQERRSQMWGVPTAAVQD